MSAQYNTEIDPASRRKFVKNIKAMQRLTGADLPKIVRNAGRDFSRSAMRYTPAAAPRKAPKTRGFAKAGWVKAMKGLGMTVKAQHHRRGGRQGESMGIFKNGLRAWRPYVDIGNATPYIMLLDRGGEGNRAAHILSRSLIDTNKKMHRSPPRLARRQGHKWKG